MLNVNFKPLANTKGKYREFRIGGGYNCGRREGDEYNVISSGISYKYKKLALFGEYGYANGSNGQTGFSLNKAQGFVVTASYNITKKLQLLARFDSFDPDLDEADNRITEYTTGLTYFVKGSSLKFLLNYVYRRVQSGTDSHRLLFGTQIIL